MVVPTKHGEQADAQRQIAGIRASALEGCHRRRVVQEPHIRVGAKPEQRRVGPLRAGRIEDFQRRGEVLLFEQTANLLQQHRVGLSRLRKWCEPSPEQEDESECRHGRRAPTSPGLRCHGQRNGLILAEELVVRMEKPAPPRREPESAVLDLSVKVDEFTVVRRFVMVEAVADQPRGVRVKVEVPVSPPTSGS